MVSARAELGCTTAVVVATGKETYLGGLAEVQVWAPGTAPPLPNAGTTATPTQDRKSVV